MTTSELVKQLFLSFSSKDEDAFEAVAREYIDREKRKKHTIVAKELEKALFNRSINRTEKSKRYKNSVPIPRDSEKGFPLLEIQYCDEDIDNLIVSEDVKEQLTQVIREFKDSDVLATYNLINKRKILFCGKPGTGKTYSAKILSSLLNIPLVYIRFDAIISSYLGETAGNLRKVFDFIESGTWVVLFDEFDIIGKNRDDNHEHGEIKRVVNNFLQMIDNTKGDSLLIAATNHQNMLDPAIWRRFDDVLYFDLPKQNSRIKLIETYLRSIKREEDIDVSELSKKMDGFSPADIKMASENAMKYAIINSKNSISMKDLEKSVIEFIKREKVRNNKLGDK